MNQSQANEFCNQWVKDHMDEIVKADNFDPETPFSIGIDKQEDSLAMIVMQHYGEKMVIIRAYHAKK